VIKINAANQQLMTWKNGGGRTKEIAIYPTDATLENFDWRISTAQIERGGPFSIFTGINRTLALLDGTTLVLHIEGNPPTHLKKGSMPVSFEGELHVSSELTGGNVSDFNVMSRRKICSHSVDLMRVDGRANLARRGDFCILYQAENCCVRLQADKVESTELYQGDAVIFDTTDRCDIELFSFVPVDIFVTRIFWSTDERKMSAEGGASGVYGVV